ncbi:hypothetical protein ONZ45_g192 [Pleurotus djamor]|nr:hypothetical protein ONZ45_g192 [Pleurotus djamor]
MSTPRPSSPPPDYTSVHRVSFTPSGSPLLPSSFSISGEQDSHLTYETTASGSVLSLPLSVAAQPPPPPSDNVVLSWTPDDLYTGPQAVSAPLDPSTSYVEARAPTTPVTYTFSPLGGSVMLLIPPAQAQDTRPLYHISNEMNCFNPLSHITTLRRGANENGDLVGEFEMGISEFPATLSIRGKHYYMRDALRKMGSSTNRIWAWQFMQRKMYWFTQKEVKVCYETLRGEGTVFARFTPSKRPRTPQHPVTMAQLEITPDGWPRLDDILMSILIVERWRQTPQNGELRHLFSFFR